MGKVLLDDIYANIGLGKFHAHLFVVCSIGFSAAAIEVMLLAFLLTELRPLWNLSEYEVGMLSAFKDAGVLAGELFWGPVADYYGRRAAFTYSMVFIVIFGTLSAFTYGIWGMIACRFLTGFGYGGTFVIDLAMFTEFLPKQQRGMMLFLFAFSWPVGQLGSTGLAWWLIPSVGWRCFVLACVVPSLLTVFLRPFYPESPRWLCSQGRSEEATEICRSIAIENGVRPEDVGILENSQVTAISEASELAPEHPEEDHTFAGLFSTKIARTTFGLMAVVLALNFATYGSQTFMPTFLKMKGLGEQDLYLTMTLNACSQFPGVLLAMLMAGSYGRLITVHAYMFVATVSLILFAYATSDLGVMACSCFVAGALEGGWAVFHVYMPEVYMTKLRGTAGGFLEGFGTVSSMVIPFFVAFCLEEFRENMLAVYLIALSVAVGGFVAFFCLNTETKDRDLDDGSTSAVHSKLGLPR